MTAAEVGPESAPAEWPPWEAIQAVLTEYHWALQDCLRSLVVRDGPSDGRISPCPRCKGDGRGPPGDGGLAQRKQHNIQQALHHPDPALRRADLAGGVFGRARRSRPFAVLWRWRGLDSLGGAGAWERQCWFCDGVGIMPVVNLHGYLCAWAPAAVTTRPPPSSAPTPTAAAPPRPSTRPRDRALRRRAALAYGSSGAAPRFRVMRVSKAHKVTGESTQRYTGSLVPAFEVRERAEQMPHWHDARSRRRGNLLEFDWRRAQWIADVQNIAESGPGPASPPDPPRPSTPGPSHVAGTAAAGLAKAAHLAGGERRAGGSLAGLERVLGRWSHGGEARAQGREAGRAAEGAPSLGASLHGRMRGGDDVAHRSDAGRGSAIGHQAGGGRGRPPGHVRKTAHRPPHPGGAATRLERAPPLAGGAPRPVTLDADFPEDLVSIRPGYEEEEQQAAVVPFRDRIFHPRLRAAPLLQPMLRISEALSLSFLREHQSVQRNSLGAQARLS